jgi:hypothetical protein
MIGAIVARQRIKSRYLQKKTYQFDVCYGGEWETGGRCFLWRAWINIIFFIEELIEKSTVFQQNTQYCVLHD